MDGQGRLRLQPLADFVLERIKQGERIFADETTLPTLAPGSGKTQKAWLWAYARDDRPFGGTGPPMVAYRFEDSRAGECAARHLAGFAGILQVRRLCRLQSARQIRRRQRRRQLAGLLCPRAARFYELHVNGELAAGDADASTQMAALWEIEADIRGQTA